ncbi:hypothetical protein RW1_019_00090 [Rhodococcus wratislaviensis NBRC 100605]|uniref:Uncharacterized protein n=1 Tax=Rhodococcus wratislaviensis NBRC 100605 TaxID=1219028 RepID=X0PQZ7_RHOWR|nr:hypothetical protein RW1_019_00090 [Rhodococcus wratislaviensis NBRC 100605]
MDAIRGAAEEEILVNFRMTKTRFRYRLGAATLLRERMMSCRAARRTPWPRSDSRAGHWIGDPDRRHPRNSLRECKIDHVGHLEPSAGIAS